MFEKNSVVPPVSIVTGPGRGRVFGCLLAALALSCSNDKPSAGATLDNREQTACEGADCGAQFVGTECSAELACPAGSYCGSSGRCGSDCGTNEQCRICNSEGHCLSATLHSNTFGSNVLLVQQNFEAQDAAPPSCVDLDVEFERVTPTVMLLIDQSGTMLERFPQSQGSQRRSRWQTVVNALVGEDSFVKRLNNSVRFGLALYTSDDGFGPGGGRECPVLTQAGEISLGAFDEMKVLLESSANGPSGDTPTAESVAAVATQLVAYAEEGPKSIILATDGVPDSCEVPNPDSNGQVITRQASVAAVAAASAAGIATRIISVGDDVGLEHLKDLAVAGAGGEPSAEAYQALDTETLENAFNEIIGSVRTCDFELGGTVLLEEAQRGTVVLDGQRLKFKDANGWEMPNDQTVRLLGKACETAQGDAADLTMKFPCDVIELHIQ